MKRRFTNQTISGIPDESFMTFDKSIPDPANIPDFYVGVVDNIGD